MKIYILVKSQGEYSDREEYLIKAYYSEDNAKQALIKAEEQERTDRFEYNNLFVKADKAYFNNDFQEYRDLMHERACSDFEESTFFISEVEVEE